MFFAENVKGLVTHDKGRIFNKYEGFDNLSII